MIRDALMKSIRPQGTTTNHKIRIWRDGPGYWAEITDRRTGVIVQTTWGPGSAKAAKRDARQAVESFEFAEAMASSARGAA